MKRWIIYLRWLWIRWTRWRKYDTELPKRETKLRITGLTVSSQWWTPEFKEIMCEICKEDNNNKCNLSCQVGNPWCG